MVCGLGLLSLLEGLCIFVTDQTASESSQSLSCLCAFALSPQLFFWCSLTFCHPCFPMLMFMALISLPPSCRGVWINKVSAHYKSSICVALCFYFRSSWVYLCTELYRSVALAPAASQHHPLRCNMSAWGSSSYQSSRNHSPAIPSWDSQLCSMLGSPINAKLPM